MTRKLLLSTVATIALSGAAFAADLPSRAPAPMPYAPPVFTWTGFYVGGSAGLADTHSAYDFSFANGNLVKKYTIPGYGLIAGLDAGYNYQVGSIVFGLEADWSVSTADGKGSDNQGYSESTKLRSIGTFRGRLGYAVDRALFYVTGGLAWGDVRNFAGYPTGSGNTFFSNVENISTSGYKTGWTLGAGMEYAVSPHWTVRAEALYVDLGKTSLHYFNNYCNFSFKNTAVVARVGVNYKF